MANPAPGGGVNSRPLYDTLAESGPAIPDDSIGPEERAIAQRTEEAEGPDPEALAEKLRREAERFLRARGPDA